MHFPQNGVVAYANTQVGKSQFVSTTTAVTNGANAPTGSATFNITPCWITGQAWSAGGLVDIFLPDTSNSNAGYMFRYDTRAGVKMGNILTVPNVSASIWGLIGTSYVANNPAAFTGWVDFAIYLGLDGYMA